MEVTQFMLTLKYYCSSSTSLASICCTTCVLCLSCWPTLHDSVWGAGSRHLSWVVLVSLPMRSYPRCQITDKTWHPADHGARQWHTNAVSATGLYSRRGLSIWVFRTVKSTARQLQATAFLYACIDWTLTCPDRGLQWWKCGSAAGRTMKWQGIFAAWNPLESCLTIPVELRLEMDCSKWAQEVSGS